MSLPVGVDVSIACSSTLSETPFASSLSPIATRCATLLASRSSLVTTSAGQQWQHAAQNGFEAAVRSWEEFNKGWTSIAAEFRDYSKNAFEDATNAWGRVLSARTLPDVVEVQSEYARKSYEKQIAQATKLGQMYVGLFENAYRPVEQTFKS